MVDNQWYLQGEVCPQSAIILWSWTQINEELDHLDIKVGEILELVLKLCPVEIWMRNPCIVDFATSTAQDFFIIFLMWFIFCFLGHVLRSNPELSNLCIMNYFRRTWDTLFEVMALKLFTVAVAFLEDHKKHSYFMLQLQRYLIMLFCLSLVDWLMRSGTWRLISDLLGVMQQQEPSHVTPSRGTGFYQIKIWDPRGAGGKGLASMKVIKSKLPRRPRRAVCTITRILKSSYCFFWS